MPRRVTKNELVELRDTGKVPAAEVRGLAKSRERKPVALADPTVKQTEAIHALATATSKAAEVQAQKINDLVKAIGRKQIIVERPESVKPARKWKINVHRDNRKLIKTLDVEVVG